jgi:hypothetical protein
MNPPIRTKINENQEKYNEPKPAKNTTNPAKEPTGPKDLSSLFFISHSD